MYNAKNIIELRDRFKNKKTKGKVVKELSKLPNKEVALILGIDEKYYARLKTEYNCNFFQRNGIEY